MLKKYAIFVNSVILQQAQTKKSKFKKEKRGNLIDKILDQALVSGFPANARLRKYILIFSQKLAKK